MRSSIQNDCAHTMVILFGANRSLIQIVDLYSLAPDSIENGFSNNKFPIQNRLSFQDLRLKVIFVYRYNLRFINFITSV